MRSTAPSSPKKPNSYWKLNFLILVLQVVSAQAALTVTDIAASANHTLFLKSDGSMWGMGENGLGELGWATLADTNRPIQIVGSNVTAIAAGRMHSLFLKSDGSLWGMGFNHEGELGDGTFSPVYTPKQIVSNDVVAIAAGSNHSLFLKSGGGLWGMGSNVGGELGDGRTSVAPPYGTNTPVQIVSNNVIAIAGGATFSLFLKSDGSLWAMGWATFIETNRPTQIVDCGVTAVAAGDRHALFLKSNGSLWVMGENGSGQLGDGTHDSANQPIQIVASGVVAVAAGEEHSLFVKSNGSLWGCGLNEDGELGQGYYGFNYSISTPVQIVPNNVVAITAGDRHSVFLKADGSLWVMGDNWKGQLGDGFVYDPMPLPEQVVPSPKPVLKLTVPSSLNPPYSQPKTNLHFTASCQFGGTFYLLSTTNLSLPRRQWRRVATNVISYRYSCDLGDFTGRFDVTLKDELNSNDPQRFYMLLAE